MSFWPLPKTLCDLLASATERGPVVELGAGSGELARALAQLSLDPVLIDRSMEALVAAGAAHARAVGDLMRLPLRSASAGALVLGNVARHLPANQRTRAAVEAARVLVPGGFLAVLEDDPAPRTAAEANYRTALELLSLADPGRGAATAASAVRETLGLVLGDPIAVGKGDNTSSAREPLTPVHWLEGRSQLPFPRERLAQLRHDIEQDGLAYGRFWFQVYRRGAD